MRNLDEKKKLWGLLSVRKLETHFFMFGYILTHCNNSTVSRELVHYFVGGIQKRTYSVCGKSGV